MSTPIIELTASMVKSFKQCPRRYELEYVHNLKPRTPAEYLTTGADYHSKVEAILKREEWDNAGVTGAMAGAFDEYSGWREWDLEDVEKEFKVYIGDGVWLKGKMDAVLKDGTPIEHKTFGGGDWDKYVNHLAWDDQVTLYLLATDARRVIYTVCKKPTIRQKKDETEDEYWRRCADWYDEDKFRVFNVTRARGEIEAAGEDLIVLADVIQRGVFYRNPQACSLVACPYESICLSYRGEIVPVNFERKERSSEELCRF
ncbi:MAG: PD-(D/E)XK nuclease family protein [Fretibacterium sp.]|nr:PD-(D/E)XK nuclease family protein [Fretibacterium sp.]